MEVTVIVEQAKKGDNAALERLVDAHRDMALGYARSILRDEHRAEDAVQEAMVIVHLRLNRLLDSAAFVSWLRGIVRNRCLHALGPATMNLDEAESAAIEDGIVDRIDYARLVDAIAQLPGAQREVLSLHYQVGLSITEIGHRLRISKGTVNMRLHAARTRLRRRLNMNEEELNTPHVGRVVESSGPLVTLKFKPGEVPLLLSKLNAGGDELCVVRSVPDGIVQAVSISGGGIWTPGREVVDPHVPFLDEIPDPVALSLVAKSGSGDDALQTGIKSIDLFAPMTPGGTTCLFCEWGVGWLVLAPEVVGRLEKANATQRIVSFVPALRDEKQWREMNGEAALGSHRVEILYIPVRDPIASSFVDRVVDTDTKLVLSRRLAEQNIWPCIDPLRSCARVAGSKVANEVRTLLSDYYRLQFGTQDHSLTAEEWLTVRRARMASQFLSQPFFVAEPYTKRPGQIADPAVATATFAGILAGDFDGHRKEAFAMSGDRPA